MSLACLWRRRKPLWFLIVVVALVFPLSSNLAPASSFLTAVYVGLLPAYAVAAWEDRRRAWLGLAILVLASAVGQLLIRHTGVANYAPSLFTICAAWATGRAIRARRAMDEELEQTTSLVAAEGDDRAQLAVAGERSRIARDLHAARRTQCRGDGGPGRSRTRTARHGPRNRGRGPGGRRGRRPSGPQRDAPNLGRSAPTRPGRRSPRASTGSRPDIPARSRVRASTVNTSNSPSKASRDRCLPASTSGSTESLKTRWPAFVRT